MVSICSRHCRVGYLNPGVNKKLTFRGLVHVKFVATQSPHVDMEARKQRWRLRCRSYSLTAVNKNEVNLNRFHIASESDFNK
ncbi:hypothetical protein TNCV_1820321 [Trichonephila clavipes]|nr:hypothetical protein TNCV_1820321 [Trichonephila clavipes]